ncbi:MAG: hypothetical protein KDA89_13505 [Planctomycetaceae bacterium]|nr:hypothetical protein [Planctomycetaceae bacterium]
MTVDWDSFTDRTIEAAEVRLLGLADTASVLALQKLMMHDVRLQTRLSAAVLLCEHPSSITIGRDGNLLELPADARDLESRLLQVHRVEREGGTILHQPGQLAGYVVVSLAECSYGENELRWRLQDAVIAACREVQVTVRRDPDDSAILNGRHGMLCETCLGLDNGISSFGLYLNINCRLDEAAEFGRGLKGTRISSVNAERVRPAQMSQIRTSLAHHICHQIGYPDYHLHTGHPFLRRRQVQSHTRELDD